MGRKMPKARGNNNIKIKPVLHIFCEGNKTEPNYLNGYLLKFCSGFRLIKIENTNKNTPIQLVDEAIKLKSSDAIPKHDVFWVVYDREAKSKYSDALHQRAFKKAKDNAINIALSNVCFEIWILLHFIEMCAPYSNYTELMRRSKLKENLNMIGIIKYDKSDKNIFNLICENIKCARKRAEKMNQSIRECSTENCEKPHLLNPYTGMPYLLDAIDKFVEEFK